MNDGRFCVGIDWAKDEHEVCVVDAAGTVVGRKSFKHSGEGLGSMCTWLLGIARSTDLLSVAIEVPHGPVVETLLERCIAVFAINPKQLDRFRDRFSVAGSKNDRLDAQVLADSLRTDERLFRRVQIDEAEVIELREWSRLSDTLAEEQKRLCNRIRQQLLRYYPQMLEVTQGDVGAEFALVLWDKLPTPASARRVRAATVERMLKRYRIRRINAAELLDVLRQPALLVSPGTVDAAQAHICVMADVLRAVNRRLTQARKRIGQLCDAMSEASAGNTGEPSDVEILASLTGVGPIVLGTLLSEATAAIRDRSYHSLRTLSGIAPVTRQSGKSRVVGMRRACHPRLRNAMFYWTRIAIQHDPLCHDKYAALRSRGCRHGRALRSVGDGLLRVACAMLRERTLFDPTRRRPLQVTPPNGPTIQPKK